jgi:hypothetical protein
MFLYGEITERVYKGVLNKLNVQLGRVESGRDQVVSLEESFSKDWFEGLADAMRRFLGMKKNDVATRYMYYRAQSILARKVLKNLEELSRESEIEMFKGGSEMRKVLDLYVRFRENAGKKMEAVFESNRAALERMNETLAARGLFKTEEAALNDLFRKEMITPKLHIMLYNELERESLG